MRWVLKSTWIDQDGLRRRVTLHVMFFQVFLAAPPMAPDFHFECPPAPHPHTRNKKQKRKTHGRPTGWNPAKLVKLWESSLNLNLANRAIGVKKSQVWRTLVGPRGRPGLKTLQIQPPTDPPPYISWLCNGWVLETVFPKCQAPWFGLKVPHKVLRAPCGLRCPIARSG